MLIRSFHAATITAALFALGSLQATAADQPTPLHVETHIIALDHQVQTASNSADHEAVAQRFEDEAAQLDQQAAELERLASQYRGALSSHKWGSNSTALGLALRQAHQERQGRRCGSPRDGAPSA